MPNNIKKNNKADTPFNAQFNVLIENELNAISKIPPEYIERAFNLLEQSLEHKKQIDNEIINLENRELDIKQEDTKKYYFWSGAGILLSNTISLAALIAGIALSFYGYEVQSFIAFGIFALNALPKILKAFRKKS